MPKPPIITRVRLRNYKSIARCDVQLGPLSILVGPNGSGKSNFLDALALVHAALIVPMHQALRARHGIAEVMRRSPEHEDTLHIELHFALPDAMQKGRYGFEVTSRDKRSYTISREVCEVYPTNGVGEPVHFEVKAGEIVDTNVTTPLPQVPSDRLYLVSVSGVGGFGAAYSALSDMEFYKYDLNQIREHQPADDLNFLVPPNGANVASVLGAIEREDFDTFDHIQRYMRTIVPGLERVSKLEIPTVNQESVDTIQFTQQFGDREHPQIFTAINMSDGTLRALAILTSLLQGGDYPPSVIGIEEPEIALHPAAAGVLWDALTDGSERSQVLISTQSPDLLDRNDIPIEAILAVDMAAGKTEIGRIAESSRRLPQERLATPGELLRQRRLSPNEPFIYPQSSIPSEP